MITIDILVFNPFQVNSYILSDETKECVIIDPACNDEKEKLRLTDFINSKGLKPVKMLITHCHIDHILGINFMAEKYGIGVEFHRGGLIYYNDAPIHGMTFGFDVEKPIKPQQYLNEGDVLNFGNSTLEMIHTPGHADGSLCFYNKMEKFVIVGDVLFAGSIGRTDLPTGNHEMLIENITKKLFALGDDFTVFPGHGPSTTIGEEKRTNPFL